MICNSPWCSREVDLNPTSKNPYKIEGKPVCRRCYSHSSDVLKGTGIKPSLAKFSDIRPPKTQIPKTDIVCARQNCDVELKADAPKNSKKRIGLIIACRRCYEEAWRLSHKNNTSIEFEWGELKPKGWVEPQPTTICILPWCQEVIVVQESAKVVDTAYICNKCSCHLKKLTRHPVYSSKSWQQLCEYAVKYNNIPLPGETVKEKCSMSWCNRVEEAKHRGSKSEPVCNKCYIRILYYSRRNNISWKESFLQIKPPKGANAILN